MFTFIHATKDNNGNWNAWHIALNTLSEIDAIASRFDNEPIITIDNVNVVDKGFFASVNENNERLMRRLGYRKCDYCGAWVTPQDVRNNNSTYDRSTDKRKCANCARATALIQEDLDPHFNLWGYHDTSEYVRVINGDGENFNLGNVKGVGIEMEYRYDNNNNDARIKSTRAFYDIAHDPTASNCVFRCERDCTVNGEIISNIFTKKSLYDFNWSILTDQLRHVGNDERRANVGFHVHLSKLWLGDDEKTQALNFLKLQYFLKCYEDDFFKMSGRKRDEMEWCEFYSQSDIEGMRNEIVNGDEDVWDYLPSGHGYALISSGRTIELRIGKSTNDPVKIANYLKFVLGIVENIKNVPFEKCYCIGKVTKLVPNEVMTYWRNAGCFLNTKAIETRGVTLNA